MEQLEREDVQEEYQAESTQEQQSNVQKTYNNGVEPAETEKEVVMNVSNNVLHYKEAENLIQKKCKEFVQEHEVQKNTSSVLAQTKMRIVEQINKEQKLVDVLKLEAEKISTQETRSREEIVQAQQFLENAGEIKEKLQEYTKTMLSKIKNINTGLEETFKRLEGQKMYEKNIKAKASNIQRLKKALDDARNSKKDDDYDSIKRENIRLKQILLEKKNHLETLKTRYEENKKHQELNSKLQEEKEKWQSKIKENEMKLTEIQCKTEQAIIDRNFMVTNLQQECETKRHRMISLENEVANTTEKVINIEVNIKKLEGAIYEERSIFNEINAKIDDKKKYIAELEAKLNCEEKKNKLDDIKKKIASAENALVASTIETREKMKLLDDLSQVYSSKMEEKNGLIVEKEAALNKKQLDVIKNQLLDEKIATAEIKLREAKDKFKNISSEPCLLQLTKEKTYLEACELYDEETVKILEKEIFEAQQTLNELTQEVKANKIKLKEVRKDTPNPRDISTLAGILRRDNLPRKSTSPKIVQFLNVSSEESNASYCDNEQQAAYDRICKDYARVEENKNKKKKKD